MDAQRSASDWEQVTQRADFQRLVRHKAKFIIKATIFFVVYYFALLVLVGYSPNLMKKRIWGEVNLAYAFALSQFFMAWVIALLYVRAAAGWDKESAAIKDSLEGKAAR